MDRGEGVLGRLGGVGLPGRCQPIHRPSAAFLPLQGNTVESEHLSELTEEEYEAHYIRRQDLKGFLWLDVKYLNPFFTRRLTQEVGHRPGPHGQGSLAFLPQRPRVGTGQAHMLCWGEAARLPPPTWLSFPGSHLLFFLCYRI